MQLGNQVEWALHCVVALAGLTPEARLSATALADLYEVPPKYLAKALQALANAELVTTTPGPKGGYRLARQATQITLLDVVDAIEGKAPIFQCQEIRRRGPCRQVPKSAIRGVCQIAGAMHQAEQAYRAALRAKTISDLVNEVVREVPPVVLNVVKTWVADRVTGIPAR